ncbi:hypothetical protein A2U01_0075718, partial [Trifolium medium]|nr:hypothetical protein [Trifolium medium]
GFSNPGGALPQPENVAGGVEEVESFFLVDSS